VQEVTRVSFSLSDKTFHIHEVTVRPLDMAKHSDIFGGKETLRQRKPFQAPKAVTVAKWPVSGSVVPDTYEQRG